MTRAASTTAQFSGCCTWSTCGAVLWVVMVVCLLEWLHFDVSSAHAQTPSAEPRSEGLSAFSTREFEIPAPTPFEVDDDAIDVPSFPKHDD